VRDDQYVLNHCTVYLARLNEDARHDFGYGHYAAGDPRARIRDAWRFPVVDTCAAPPGAVEAAEYNDVTFVYPVSNGAPGSVQVVGTFAPLYQLNLLRRVQFLGEDTSYFALTLPVPRRAIYFYRFVVDGALELDPVNPQRTRLDSGAWWSRFFTWECTEPIVLERWQLGILQRLTNHILPFRTREGQRFLSWYYDGLDAAARRGAFRGAYRLDDSVGAATYIDHILAREESHHLVDYRKCLRQIDRILRLRDPGHEPADVAREFYEEIYREMAAGDVAGWDKNDYGSPRSFLDIVRRHAFTGAFSHPKYGGNAAAAGWQYLASNFPFDWRRSLEPPLGTNTTYLG
jgi:hypothetical protein